MLLLRDLVEDSLDEGYARAARAGGRPGSRPGRVGRPGAHRRPAARRAAAGHRLRPDPAAGGLRGRGPGRAGRRGRAAVRRQRHGPGAGSTGSAPRCSGTSARCSPLTGAGAELRATGWPGSRRPPAPAPVTGPGMVVRLTTPPATATAPTWTRAPTSTPTAGSPTGTCRPWSTRSGPPGPRRWRSTASGSPPCRAIRSAGDAVLVDFRPLTPPYEIEAVGDPHKLRDDVRGRLRGQLPAGAPGLRHHVRRGGQRPAAAGRVRGCPAALRRRAGSRPSTRSNGT